MVYFKYHTYDSGFRDYNVKFGINWYDHHKKHKHRAFTIEIYVPNGVFDIDIVYENLAEYKKFISRYTFK